MVKLFPVCTLAHRMERDTAVGDLTDDFPGQSDCIPRKCDLRETDDLRVTVFFAPTCLR